MIAGCGYALGRVTMPFILQTCTHAQELCSKIVFSVMNLCITYTLCFFLECREETLFLWKGKTKRGRKEMSFEFPLLTEEILLCYASHKILCCFHLFKNNGELFGLDIHCWLLLQTLGICSSNSWLWWWAWGCAGSLSSISYSCVGTDGFIFTRLRYTVLKACRDVSFVLTKMTWFVFLFHFLSCNFCGLFELFGGLLSPWF